MILSVRFQNAPLMSHFLFARTLRSLGEIYPRGLTFWSTGSHPVC